jgi:hypothetical protein
MKQRVPTSTGVHCSQSISPTLVAWEFEFEMADPRRGDGATKKKGAASSLAKRVFPLRLPATLPVRSTSLPRAFFGSADAGRAAPRRIDRRAAGESGASGWW